ncbi:FAD-binding oxidoreductase [Candidatus Thorarchaeota archaeon]|nr:MAG: FAD-binding oxidoreductase [Candidatus Thorarchaeota archaeon]
MKLRDVAIGANASMYYRLDFKKIKGVFYPKTERDVILALQFANENDYEVTPKGGGSGLSGACTGGNQERIMLSSLQMKELLTISKDQGYVDVQPGATPDEINELLEPIAMKLWVAPSSRDIATVGGILSTDGGGNDTWVNGTMRDNTYRVRMVLSDGTPITVDQNGVKSENKHVAERLNDMKFSIHDVASSHGTLGFITELRLDIRPIEDEETVGGIVEYENYQEMGIAIAEMIERKSPIRYGETIVMAHDDVRGDLNPPLHILEVPKPYEEELNEIVNLTKLEPTELENMKEVRIKLPKRNPKEGIQMALFEGYGLHDDSLRRMQHSISEIDSLLMDNGLTPFAKYGHAPSKWYLGNNTAAYGIIMHSREIRPSEKTGEQIYEVVMQIVNKCQELGITPKPEHKWPFSDETKKKRLQDLRDVIGAGFNSFILDPECNEVLQTMV